jgi:hypothetical protein
MNVMHGRPWPAAGSRPPTAVALPRRAPCSSSHPPPPRRSWLDKTIQGPFFLGQDFTLVDCALLPWLVRMPAFCAVTGYAQPQGLDNLQRYIGGCLERPSVAASCRCKPGTAGGGDYETYQQQMLEVYRDPQFAEYFTPSSWRPRKK